MDGPLGLIEFPADDPDRAGRFWSGLLGVELAERSEPEGRGWQTRRGAVVLGIHALGAGPGDTASLADPPRGCLVLGIHALGAGPGDTASLPYFTVADMEAALARVTALGGTVIHPGSRWAICRDSEGSPFGLALPSVASRVAATNRPACSSYRSARTPGIRPQMLFRPVRSRSPQASPCRIACARRSRCCSSRAS